MSENSFYVEGSQLDKFIEGEYYLKPVNQNKILIAVNKADYQSINAINAARATIGCNAEIIELKTNLELIAQMKNGFPTGIVNGWQELVEQVRKYEFDALGLATPITISEKNLQSYFETGGINPVGKVEAICTNLLGEALQKPVAHGPVDYSMREFREVVDPRKAVEIVTKNFIHCILKGLNKAPKLVCVDTNRKSRDMLGCEDIDLLISPMGCFGRPHKACLDKGIPIMVVRENKTALNDFEDNDERFIFVDNYIEAAGTIMCMKAGIDPLAVRRPLEQVKIYKNC